MREICVNITEGIAAGAERSGLAFDEYIFAIIQRAIRDSVYFRDLQRLQRSSIVDPSNPDVVVHVSYLEKSCSFAGHTERSNSIAYAIIKLAELNGLSDEEMLATMLHEGAQAPWAGKAA